jgi:hypothetical protein
MMMGRFHARWQGNAHPLLSFLGVFYLAKQGVDRIALLQEIPEASKRVSMPRDLLRLLPLFRHYVVLFLGLFCEVHVTFHLHTK